MFALNLNDIMIIKIDMDGVIRDIIPTIVNIYNKECGKNITANDIKEYNLNQQFKDMFEICNKLPVDIFFEDYAEEVFGNSPVCAGAKDALDMLHRAGHKIIICTWQYTYLNKQLTLKYLEDNGLYYDDICFTKDKHLIKGDFLVDDNPEFLTKEKETNPNCKNVCISASYNDNFNKTAKFDSLYKFATALLEKVIF